MLGLSAQECVPFSVVDSEGNNCRNLEAMGIPVACLEQMGSVCLCMCTCTLVLEREAVG